ncbi:MAG: NFACT RNA binding domain-containing protein [Sandaracinaceae bacterium]|nr:NFACT RNA binding domain-containing protein [Sandaracinaceae bacterium]
MCPARARATLARAMGSKGRPYRTIEVEGYEVLVGRSDDDNDYLTFRVAQKRDLWLHAGGGTPGSHVVIRNPDGGEIPKSVVEKAAQLAAWYSKARGAPRVEVHVCRVSDVSKPKGAPRGQVQIKKYSRVKVEPSRLEAGDED